MCLNLVYAMGDRCVSLHIGIIIVRANRLTRRKIMRFGALNVNPC